MSEQRPKDAVAQSNFGFCSEFPTSFFLACSLRLQDL